jgi:hypothetical protein
MYSDDNRKTWQLGGVEEEKTNESTVLERADGSLLHNMRRYQRRSRGNLQLSVEDHLQAGHLPRLFKFL